MLVTQGMCAENTFILEKSPSPITWPERGRCVIVPPEFLKFYLLLYTAYFH
jgi:hypothetical protein